MKLPKPTDPDQSALKVARFYNEAEIGVNAAPRHRLGSTHLRALNNTDLEAHGISLITHTLLESDLDDLKHSFAYLVAGLAPHGLPLTLHLILAETVVGGEFQRPTFGFRARPYNTLSNLLYGWLDVTANDERLVGRTLLGADFGGSIFFEGVSTYTHQMARGKDDFLYCEIQGNYRIGPKLSLFGRLADQWSSAFDHPNGESLTVTVGLRVDL